MSILIQPRLRIEPSPRVGIGIGDDGFAAEIVEQPGEPGRVRADFVGHPGTTVLSLETGHERDYSEGAAYRDYFATDELMFAVPELSQVPP